jgi:membrane protein
MSSRRTNEKSDTTSALPEALRGGRKPVRPEQPDGVQDNDEFNMEPPPVDASGNVQDDGRGRDADKPQEIPAKGWKDVGARVWKETKDDNVGLIGAGVAFYTILAIFPALVAMISLYGLLVDRDTAIRQTNEMLDFIPEQSREVIQKQLESITTSPETGLGIGLAVSLAAALWSASGGMRALMKGLNVAYDEKETRKFVKLRLVSLALTLGAVVFAVLSLAGVIGVPAAFDASEPIGMALAWLRWPLLAAVMVGGLAVIYRYGPDRDKPEWGWVSWGAGIAMVLWLAMTAAFSFYVSSFGKFNETYGTLAGVVVLMLWLSLSAFVVLLGAEINSELERQTAKDTTAGPDRPIGQRDAYAADTVGESADKVMKKGKNSA